MSGKDDLAYGHYPGQQQDKTSGEGSARSLLGSTFRTFRDKYDKYSSNPQQQQQQQPPQQHQQQYQQQQQPPQQYGPQGGHTGQPPYQGYSQPQSQPFQQHQGPPQGAPGQYQSNPQYGGGPTQTPNPSNQDGKPAKPDLISGLLGKVQGYGSEFAQRIGSNLDPQAYATYSTGDDYGSEKNKHGSFAPQRSHNDAKWYVDGCSYMWAVSRALETARESIWILDWWLSPELYLRRPPSKNEQYRLDRMLQAAAQRGVKVNIIVYKEVTQALSLSSHHTKHHLQDLHPNIAVLRHPDHLPDRKNIHNSVLTSLQNMTLNPAGIAKLSGDALKGVYGMNDNVILYWAHHEKLCLIDGKTAFMGGLDLCFGRWDTHQHSIADAHPSDLGATIFPGQDYNNARILDFQDVVNWDKNQLDRKVSSRMGWSDIAVSLHGPVVEDLRKHFVDRWNFIYDEKYAVRKDDRHSRLVLYNSPLSFPGGTGHSAHQQGHPPPQSQTAGHGPPQTTSPPPAGGPQGYQQVPPPPPGQHSPVPHSGSGYQAGQPQWSSSASTPSYGGNSPHPPASTQTPQFAPSPIQGGPHSQTRGFDGHGEGEQHDGSRGVGSDARGLRGELSNLGNFGNVLRGQLAAQVHQYQDKYLAGKPGSPQSQMQPSMSCQIVRSSCKWSHGGETEHSIANAYCSIIRDSEHFVYIENQFFITATSDEQKPVMNKIGAAIVERILRAARAKQRYHMIVVIPSVPGFPGDLREDGSLGTRAIMEFQYHSINRGGHSIMEVIAREGFNPMEYIRFYNLRNYDRINVSATMRQAEQSSGVNYEDARQQYDSKLTGSRPSAFDTSSAYPQYQQAAQNISQGQPGKSGRWDSVSECYMLGGEDIRNVPWEHEGDLSEIDAFVSEELYVHSKVLIADDRTVICGSANINDRSQLGNHDSEIAVIIQDPAPLESTMNGQAYVVSRFAATLRRELCRKHLGLIPAQDCQMPNANFEPVGVPNQYDIGSPEDRAVADPVSDAFLGMWNSRAKQNTEVYRQVFHAVPDDTVRNWNDYKEFYEYYFHQPEQDKDKGQEQNQAQDGMQPPARYLWGHVIRDEFPEGVQAVKEQLSKVKGTLVEMPLMFLVEEDIAQEGLGLNSLTEEIYT